MINPRRELFPPNLDYPCLGDAALVNSAELVTSAAMKNFVAPAFGTRHAADVRKFDPPGRGGLT